MGCAPSTSNGVARHGRRGDDFSPIAGPSSAQPHRNRRESRHSAHRGGRGDRRVASRRPTLPRRTSGETSNHNNNTFGSGDFDFDSGSERGEHDAHGPRRLPQHDDDDDYYSDEGEEDESEGTEEGSDEDSDEGGNDDGSSGYAEDEEDDEEGDDDEGEESESDSSANAPVKVMDMQPFAANGPTGGRRSRDPTNESDLSSISSDPVDSDDGDRGGGHRELPSFGHRGSVEMFVPPEQFVFSDFDVPTVDDAEERLARSLQRRDSRFNFGDVELDNETEVESNIVKRYLQGRRKSGEAVDDSFLWGDVNLDYAELTKQHQIRKELSKQKKAVDGVTITNHVGLPDRIKCLAVLPGELVYASCDCNCNVMRTYDTQSGMLRLSFIGHQEPIMYVCFSPNCKHIATASADGGVVVWDTVTTKAQAILPHPKAVASCVFTGNSKSLVTSCWDNVCRTWEIKKKKLLRTYTEHRVFVFALDAHPKYDVIVSGGVDGTVMLWTSLTAVTKAVLRGHTSAVLSVKFSPQGSRIVSNDESTIRIWNTMTTVCVVTLSIDLLPCEINGSHPRRRTWIVSAFCPVGEVMQDEALSLHVIASCSDKSVHILQASTGKDVYSFTSKAPVYQIAAGARSTVVCGDCFGNIMVATIR